MTGLPPCVNPCTNLHSLFNLFKGLTSLKLLMKRFGVDYHLFWDLFNTINFKLGPIPQIHYYIVDLFQSPYNYLRPVAQFDSFLNDLSYLEPANSFSNMWILSCVFKSLFCVNDMPHLVQVNGLSAPRIL